MAISFGIKILALLAAPAAALAADSPALAANSILTIEEAVNEALQNNPGLLAERLAIPVADAAVITAKLRPNPVISASSDHLDALGTGFNETNNAGPAETALRVDFPLERGHKREFRLDTAGFARRLVETHLSDSARKIRLDVTLACIDVMEAKAKLALANDNLTTLEELVRLNTTRSTAGAIAPVELTRSKVAMLQFRNAVRAGELTLATARIRVQTLLGRKPDEALIDIADEMKTSIPETIPDLTQVQATALSARPDLAAIKLEQARSRADLRLQIAQGKVDYSVGVEYRRQQGINGRGNSLGFFFSAPLPLFNRNQGEIARAGSEEAQFGKNLEATQAQVAGEVVTAYKEYAGARRMIADIEKDLLAPSQEARDTTAYVYKAGASSLMEVLDAQRAFNETMSAYYSSQADYRRAISRLTFAVGKEVIP